MMCVFRFTVKLIPNESFISIIPVESYHRLANKKKSIIIYIVIYFTEKERRKRSNTIRYVIIVKFQ